MDYRGSLKQLLMTGQMFAIKGQGIASMGSGISQIQLQNYRGTGTISHRASVGAMDPIMQRMNDLNIKGQGAIKTMMMHLNQNKKNKRFWKFLILKI